MTKPLLVANWKMNPATMREAVLLAKKIEAGIEKRAHVSCVVAPPSPFLQEIKLILGKAKLGAQDAFWEGVGPYTGAVSWRQLKTLGVRYAIVGHSERKTHFSETDEIINKKVRSLLGNGMHAILCVGEKERAGNEIPDTVRKQLEIALADVKKDVLRGLIIAYEPVWAISTMPDARPDTPENAFQAKIFIRTVLAKLYGKECAERIPILYGGSVHAGNIISFLRQGKMEGALVGGASLKAAEFIKIIHLAASLR